jgi:N utilization substance protein A
MKTEFTAAVAQLSAERNLPKGVVLSVLESALVSAYKKDTFPPEQDILVKIDPDVGEVKVYIQKVVAEPVTDPLREISLGEARELQGEVQVSDVVEIESTPKNAGRIAAQVARQVISQRLREAEYHAIYEEFAGREGEIVAGTIQFINPKQIYVGLSRTEAILPFSEQVHNEHYRVGQRLKFYLLEVTRGIKEPQVVVSRSHPNLVRRLFELEIPELHNGIVELKAVAREAGYRSKVAVSTRQEGVEPVGCCLGPRGIRMQNIINELNGEKIDVIQWDANAEIFISNALKPAQATSIELDEAENVANVIVPDRQLSLAIGKEGQNARLAAKLTGWRIDIKSASAAEAEKASLQEVASEELETAAEEGELSSATTDELQPPELADVNKALASDELSSLLEVTPEKPEGEKQIRFAEDILPPKPTAERVKGGKAKGSNVKGKRYKKQIFYPEHDDYEE